MKIFAKSLLAAAAAALSIGAQAAVLIDDFSDPAIGAQLATDKLFSGVGNGAGASASQLGGMIGGARDIYVVEVGGAAPGRSDIGVEGVTAFVGGGVYSFSTDSGQYGVGIIRWDGAANTSFNQVAANSDAMNLTAAIGSINTAGFAATDLQSSSIGFTIEVLSADAGFPFTLEAYSLGGFSSVTLLSPGGPGFYFIPFAGFVGTADFTAITALQAIINFPGAPIVDVDLRIDLASTAVPEPGALALAGLALLGAGVARRFTMRAKK